MAKTKIVIFSALYMPHLGGVEKYSQSIAAELSKDCQVTVFCMNTEKQPDIIREGNVTVHFLPCFSLQNGRFPVPKPTAIRKINKELDKIQPDFGIVQCRFYLLSWHACRILGHRNIPFIQIEHGAGDIVMDNPIVNLIWHLYEAFLTQSEKRIPHDYYAVSHAGLRWLEHFGIKGVGVISNSIAPRDFDESLQRPRQWRKTHGIPDEATLITFTGRIMRDKGITDLLEAFDQLKGKNLFLVAAGSGDMKIIEPWRDQNNIIFPGQLDFSEIPALLADTQIFCLPSHFTEGKPTSVLEAGYCRNAVVSTNSGGTVEIIPNDDYGRLIPAGDIPALSSTLQFLVDHPEEQERIGFNLHQRIVAEFTWETAAARVREAMRRYGL